MCFVPYRDQCVHGLRTGRTLFQIYYRFLVISFRLLVPSKMEKLVLIVALVALHLNAAVEAHCTPSITKVSAGDAPLGQLCSGQLVLNEDFDTLDTQVPIHLLPKSGQWLKLYYSNVHSTQNA